MLLDAAAIIDISPREQLERLERMFFSDSIREANRENYPQLGIRF
jgi:hypothetical protein